MSALFKNSYFYPLPNEVLLKILSGINIVNLLDFCDAYDCDYFLQDRNVIKKIDLCRKYQLGDISQISQKIAFQHVTTLNINCVYWIEAEKLRKFVTKLVNLEVLYAIQTNLSLSATDTEAFSKLKVKKLGISVNRGDEIGNHEMPTVQTLYISIVNVETIVSPMVLEMIFPRLTKLWIDVEEYFERDIILHCLNVENKSKIFWQVNAHIPSINFEHYGLTTYYKNYRVWKGVMCCEKLSGKQLRSRPESIVGIESTLGSWKVLDELHPTKPYGPRDARRLHLKEYTLDNIFFEELNFYHSNFFCNTTYNEAIEEILRSSCAKQVKKLFMMTCLLQNKNATASLNMKVPDSLSRKRMRVENSVSTHPIDNIFKNFPALEHLEIHSCRGSAHHSSINKSYLRISMFEHLESLIVEIPVTVDGSFLIQVLKKCKNLHKLKVTSVAQNEELDSNICSVISSASSLKDFGYENHCIQLNKLLENVCLIKSKKLERIAFTCTKVDNFSPSRLKQFLETNPQLIFLYFLIRDYRDTSIKMVQKILYTYKIRHPSKVFRISKTYDRSDQPVPDVHFCEVVNNTTVAHLNALEDFELF